MRTITFILLIAVTSFVALPSIAQTAGVMSTSAGCLSCITTTAEGAPATSADLKKTAGLSIDAAHDIYIGDMGYHKVRKINRLTGNINTIAGNGTPGFSGDGGPATAAMLNMPQGIDIRGTYMYIADYGNGRIRKVDLSTNMITTIAGGGASTSDGVPATTANLNSVACVYADGSGNIYTSDASKIRKIDPSGIISSVAGGGVSMADGVPATSAYLSRTRWIQINSTGDILLVPGSGDRIRKVDASTSLITTIAGGGSSSADGIPATSAKIDSIHNFSFDASGNIYIACFTGSSPFFTPLIRKIDVATGLITTIAGGGTSLTDGDPALCADVTNYQLFVDDWGGNIYFSDFSTRLRRFPYSVPYMYSWGSAKMNLTINKLCAGPELTIATSTFSSGLTVKTWFGDGTTDISSLSASCSGGFVTVNHSYVTAGTYTIRHQLFSGTTLVDSMQYSFNQVSCNVIPIKFFLDDNGDCLKNSTENYLSLPVIIAVDSNSVPVDTISCTSGLNYYTYGAVGDIYKFKMIAAPGGLITSCPAIVIDTVQNLSYNHLHHEIGLSCGTPGVDLALLVYKARRGGHFYENTYITNSFCNTASAVINTYCSPKTNLSTFFCIPNPTTILGNTATWNLGGVSVNNSPLHIHFEVEPIIWTIGDTFHITSEIIPVSGETIVTNNTETHVDSMNGPRDPNDIQVSPACFSDGTDLHYVIHFENTGNDTAHNVYVMDTLSDYVDPKSLRIELASAQMFTSFSQANGHNIVKFDFPDINLLDSAHYGLNDGAIFFTIRTVAGLPDGTHVLSNAGIYFDDNDVVNTNVAEASKGCWQLETPVVKNTPTLIFPNPAQNELFIQTDEAYNICTISNSIGQLWKQQPLTSARSRIDISSLPPGMYYITLKGDEERLIKKFTKL